MKRKKKETIDAQNFSLDEWLRLIFSDQREIVLPNNCFPNEKAKDEYLERAKDLSDKEVKDLLRVLLQKTGRIGYDNFALKNLFSLGKDTLTETVAKSEYWKRNISGRTDVWEGITWVIDLLPHYPKEAIRAIDAYFYANGIHMTDNQIFGGGDCSSIIRAKYFDVEHPRTILLDIDPTEFEWLVEELYNKLGYETKLTPVSYDKGIDIIATKNSIGKKELTLIQCKRYKGTVGASFVRDLKGTVSSAKATKGVLVSSSEFSKEAIKFAEDNPNIELIGYKKLNKLLNMHLGAEWTINMDYIFRDKRQQQAKEQQTKTN